MNRSLLTLVLVAASALAAPSGCTICAEGAVCDAAPDDPAAIIGTDVCNAFCDRLVACGVVAGDEAAACRAQCGGAMDRSAAETRQGCRCVIEDACRAHYDCPGAPLPDGASGGGAGGSGGGGAPGCGAGPACATPQQCVSGSCRTPCDKSCECAEGESCESGFCGVAEPAPVACQDDCDCPSGQTCTAGSCG